MLTDLPALDLPRVSIIIPCYNAEKYIAEAIQSALDQTYSNCEIIVIDDGSTDGSLEVIRAFENRIYWESGPNRGACAARNTGIRLAKGDFVQFLDSDDLLTPNCVEKQVLSSTSPKELSCSRLFLMISETAPNDTYPWNFRYDLPGMLRYGAPATSATLYRRESLIGIGGFREHLRCAQDYDLNLRLVITYGISLVPSDHVGVKVRPVKNSLSRSAAVKMPLAKLDVLMEAQKMLEKKGSFDEDCRIAIARHYTAIARTLWRFGKIEDAGAVAKLAQNTSRNRYRGCYGNFVFDLIASLVGFTIFEMTVDFLKGREFPPK